MVRKRGEGKGDVRNMEETMIEVVNKRWRCGLKASWEKKYCSMTCRFPSESAMGRCRMCIYLAADK